MRNRTQRREQHGTGGIIGALGSVLVGNGRCADYMNTCDDALGSSKESLENCVDQFRQVGASAVSGIQSASNIVQVAEEGSNLGYFGFAILLGLTILYLNRYLKDSANNNSSSLWCNSTSEIASGIGGVIVLVGGVLAIREIVNKAYRRP